MSIQSLLLKPYVVDQWQGPDFSAWTTPSLWNITDFSSLIKGKTTLWYQTPVTGAYPNHLTDPDYVAGDTNDIAVAPAVDLTKFPSADDWHIRVRMIWRPSHIAPTLSGTPQPEMLTLVADPGSGQIILGELEQPFISPPSSPASLSLSRIEGDAGDPRVGADGLWWYTQVVTPLKAVQEQLLGQASVALGLSMKAAPRDATGYGVGVEKVVIEMMRGPSPDPVVPVFPAYLWRSHWNSTRWI